MAIVDGDRKWINIPNTQLHLESLTHRVADFHYEICVAFSHTGDFNMQVKSGISIYEVLSSHGPSKQQEKFKWYNKSWVPLISRVEKGNQSDILLWALMSDFSVESLD